MANYNLKSANSKNANVKIALLFCVFATAVLLSGCLNKEQIDQIQKLVSKANENIGPITGANATVKPPNSPSNASQPPVQPPVQPPQPPANGSTPLQPPQPPVQPPREPTQQELIQTLNETFMFPE